MVKETEKEILMLEMPVMIFIRDKPIIKRLTNKPKIKKKVESLVGRKKWKNIDL